MKKNKKIPWKMNLKELLFDVNQTFISSRKLTLLEDQIRSTNSIKSIYLLIKNKLY